MRNNILFVRFLVDINVSSYILLLKLLMYVISIAYLTFYVLGDQSENSFPGLYIIIYVLTIIPFFRVSVWKHIESYKVWIQQSFSSDQIWIGVSAFSAIASMLIGLTLLLLLKFFGLNFQLDGKVLMVVILMFLAMNAVIQFCSTLFTAINSDASTWLYLLIIPLSIPVFGSTLAAWKKRLVVGPMVESTFNNEEIWLLGIFVLFSAVSYLLFNVIWKS